MNRESFNSEPTPSFNFGGFQTYAKGMADCLEKSLFYPTLSSRLAKLAEEAKKGDDRQFVATLFEIVTWRFSYECQLNPTLNQDRNGFPDIICDRLLVECTSLTPGDGANKDSTMKYISERDKAGRPIHDCHDYTDELRRYVPRMSKGITDKIDDANRYAQANASDDRPIVLAVDASFIEKHSKVAEDTARLLLFGELEDGMMVRVDEKGARTLYGTHTSKIESVPIPRPGRQIDQTVGLFDQPVFDGHNASAVSGVLLFPNCLAFDYTGKPDFSCVRFFPNDAVANDVSQLFAKNCLR